MSLEKSVKESLVVKSEIVIPNDTNTFNNLFGGRLMEWMDIVGAIAAQRHCNSQVTTASVDNISFTHPIHKGNVVTLKAQVSRAFNTSMEVFIQVWGEDIPQGNKWKSNSAFFTYVAIDEDNHPIKVPKAIPDTDEEIELYEGALRRRQLRLILGKRMHPDDASELKSLFFSDEQ